MRHFHKKLWKIISINHDDIFERHGNKSQYVQVGIELLGNIFINLLCWKVGRRFQRFWAGSQGYSFLQNRKLFPCLMGTSWCFQSIKSSSNPLVNLLKIFWNVAPPSRKIDWWKCFQKVKGMIPWSYGRGFLPACIGNCSHILWECRQDLKSTNPKQTN